MRPGNQAVVSRIPVWTPNTCRTCVIRPALVGDSQVAIMPGDALRDWLQTQRTLKLLESELDDAISALHHRAESFESQLADFGLQRLSKADTFRFFRQLVNYDPAVLCAATSATPDVYLDYFLADSAVDCHRDHLMVGRRHVKALSMKEPPTQTFAHVLGD